MNIPFVKMEAAGNDYVYIDLRTRVKVERVTPTVRKTVMENGGLYAKKLSDRRFGIGGDGLVIISDSLCAACKMTMYNSDGSLGLMCGNAVRCVAKLIKGEDDDWVFIETDSGIKRVTFNRENITVHMGKCKYLGGDLEKMYPESVLKVLPDFLAHGLFTVGNPHFSAIVKKEDFGVFGLIAPLLSKNSLFFDGVNVEIGYIENNKITARVYERGSGETLSCGTGSCAIVAAAVIGGVLPIGKHKVTFSGGSLFVECKKDHDVYLTGNAKEVFRGVFYDKDQQ